MARYKQIDMSLRFLPVVLQHQLVPGSFADALQRLIDLLDLCGGVNIATGRWRVKKRYLFNTRALADVFRAKLLARLRADGLRLPSNLPPIWIAHCACVGDGDQALAYLAPYLYRSANDGEFTRRQRHRPHPATATNYSFHI
ncbi:MAG: transposase [Pseudomarimonas sp.]